MADRSCSLAGPNQDRSRAWHRHIAACRRCGSINRSGCDCCVDNFIVNSNLHSHRYVNLLTTTGDRADMLGPASSHPKLG